MKNNIWSPVYMNLPDEKLEAILPANCEIGFSQVSSQGW